MVKPWLLLGTVILVILAACGGKEATPTEEAVAEKQPVQIVGTPLIPFTSDILEVDPGMTVEIHTATPTPPTSQDEETILYDTAYLKKAELLQEEGGRPLIHVQGFVPTPCHKLLVKIEEIDKDNHIQVKIFSVANLGIACNQQLQPFDQIIRIGLLPPGNYSVWASIGKIGEFTVQ
jgi:hypothetical protein